jgi:SAM-dependent methyltransferase
MIVGFFPATTMPNPDWWQALWPDPSKIIVEIGVEPGVVAIDLCCGDGLFTVPLARVAKRVYAIDIDPVMLNRARSRVAEARAVDYVFLANTFHGVPDQLGLGRAVAAVLKPKGLLGIINWRRRPREETVVLGQSRGPKTEMRIEANDVAAIVQPAGLLLNRIVELPPYHYGVVFQKGGGNE